jgi:quercetin dioxygenase-like cupin family protein
MNTSAAAERTDATALQRALCTEPASGRAWWFLGTLAVLRNPEGAPREPTIIELTVPPGGSPPLHIHNTLDDSFLMLEGEVVVRCEQRSFIARPGSYVVLPAGIEHTFCVTSPQPARMLLIHATAEFLDFIEVVGKPTRDLRLPPPGETRLDRDTLIRTAENHDLRIIGAPLAAGEARALTM